MERVICLVIGYLVGSIIQAGYWIGRFNHIDIRNYGSGNAGTTNISRTLGKKIGVVTYLIDTLKVTLACAIVHFIFIKFGTETVYYGEVAPTMYSDIPLMLLYIYTGMGVVLGHNFPFYLKFKGGKGIAASSGVIFSLLLFPKHCWILTVLGFITFASVTLITKYVSVGSLTFVGLFWIEFMIWGNLGWLPLFSGRFHYEAYAVIFIMTALAYIRHRGNINRLIHGTERRIGQKQATQGGLNG